MSKVLFLMTLMIVGTSDRESLSRRLIDHIIIQNKPTGDGVISWGLCPFSIIPKQGPGTIPAAIWYYEMSGGGQVIGFNEDGRIFVSLKFDCRDTIYYEILTYKLGFSSEGSLLWNRGKDLLFRRQAK